MSNTVEAKKTTFREPLMIGVLFVLGFWWLVNTLNTGNPFWFLPFQPSYEPSRIVVRDYGTAVTLRPGDEQFPPLADAIDAVLSDFRSRDLVSIGLSDETLRRYAEEELVIEVYYPEDVEFNTSVRMTGINQLLFPIDATHAGKNYVFIGTNGEWRAGALAVADMTPLMDAMVELGYLEKQE
ncbi:MAG: hypothetical protein Kow0080_29050 [Candidatus Promineifilaceae bacterium]